LGYFLIENAEYHPAVSGKSEVDEIFNNGNARPVLQGAFRPFLGMKIGIASAEQY
jgi:hypothetical protein